MTLLLPSVSLLGNIILGNKILSWLLILLFSLLSLQLSFRCVYYISYLVLGQNAWQRQSKSLFWLQVDGQPRGMEALAERSVRQLVACILVQKQSSELILLPVHSLLFIQSRIPAFGLGSPHTGRIFSPQAPNLENLSQKCESFCFDNDSYDS